jgi:hypothetical protein
MSVLLYLIVLFIHSISVNARSCIMPADDHGVIPLNLTDFNLIDLKHSVENLTTEEEKYVACRVEIWIEYNVKQGRIAFGYIKDDISGLLTIRTGLQFNNKIVHQQIQDISLFNHLTYKCSTGNRCNYDFIYNHIQ